MEDVAKKHQIKIARQTLKMSGAMVGVMGGPTREKAKEILTTNLSKERQKAIQILEGIATKRGDEDMFDGEEWFEYEDLVTKILERD